MAKPEWGTKRTCQGCGAKFYDFGKTPIVCPKCQTVFEPEALVRPRRRAEVAPKPRPEADVLIEEDEIDEEALLEADEEEEVIEDEVDEKDVPVKVDDEEDEELDEDEAAFAIDDDEDVDLDEDEVDLEEEEDDVRG